MGDVKVEGWDPNKIAEFLLRKLHDGLLESAYDIEKRAKDLCPVDSGTLRNSIHVQDESKGTEILIKIGPSVSYGIFVEFGTGIHAEGGGGRQTAWRVKGKNGWFTTRGMPPKPFLRPAFDEELPNIQSKIKELK
jgi:HK97 gp10 family phage protein